MSVAFASASSQSIGYGDPGTPFDSLSYMVISFWAQFTSLGANRNIVSRWNYADSSNEGWLAVYSNSSLGMRFEWTYDAASTQYSLQDLFDPETGVDYHYCIVLTPSWQGMYRDGNLIVEGFNSYTTIRDNNNSLYIANQVDDANHMNGLIEAVTIWGGADLTYTLGADEIALLAAGEDSASIRASKQIFRCDLASTSDIDDEVNSLTGTAYNTPTNGADITPAYSLSATADGDSFFDDLNAADQLSTAIAGSGSASYSDNQLDLTCGASASDAAIAYYATALNPDRSQTWALMFACDSSVTTYPLYLYDHSSAPTTGTQATIEGRMRARVVFTGTTLRFEYWDASRTSYTWDNTNNYWTTGSNTGHNPTTTDDYYIVVLEFDGSGKRFRFIAYHQTQSGEDQGLYVWELTDWVPWSNVDTVDNSLYIGFGYPFTDVAVNHTLSLEHAHRSNGTQIHGWLNGAPTIITANEYSIYHYWCYDQSKPLFVPSHRGPVIGMQTTDDIKDPCVVHDDDADDTYYLYYSDITTGDIYVSYAKGSPHGPWEADSGNPVISTPAGAVAAQFPCVIKDYNQASANRWIFFYSGVTATPEWTVYRQVGSSPTSPGSETALLTKGTAGQWDDGGCNIPIVKNISGSWTIFYNGYGGSWGEWGVGAATPDDGTLLDADWTKAAGNPIIEGSGVNNSVAAGSSGRTLEVYSTTGFTANSYIHVEGGPSAGHPSRIRKITDSNTLELYHAITSPIINNAVTEANEGGIALTELVKIGSTWYLFATGFQTNDPSGGNITTESVVLYTTADADPVTATWAISWQYSPFAHLVGFDDVDYGSMENISFVNEPIQINVIGPFPTFIHT